MPVGTTPGLGEAVSERASRLLHRVMHPEEARLLARIRSAQIALARTAAEHLNDLEGTGHHATLSDLLSRARHLSELAEAIDCTPVQMVPSEPKAWEQPRAAGFLDKLSQGASRLLTQTGDLLRTTGEKIEAGRCRLEAERLYAEAGALLGGIFGAETHVPAWATEPMGTLRESLTELDAYRGRTAERSPIDELKQQSRAIVEEFGKSLNRENFKERIDDASGQTRQAFIRFTAWGIGLFESFGIFIVALGLVAVPIAGPWGAVLVGAVVYTYSKYRAEIDARVQGGSDSAPAPSTTGVDETLN